MDDQPAGPSTTGATNASGPYSALWLPVDQAFNSMVLDWLVMRAIRPETAAQLGVRSLGPAPVLCYPRRVVNGSWAWSLRRITDGRRWMDPVGVMHAQTLPWSTPYGRTRLILTEGETDFLSLASSSHLHAWDADAWCLPGAGVVPNEWAALMAAYRDIVVLADPDDAGEKLMARVSSLVPRARWGKMPHAHDVNDILKVRRDPDGIYDGVLDRTVADARPYDKPTQVLRSSWKMTRTKTSSDHRAALTDIVQMSGVKLRRRGAHELVGLCPFHDEDTPSFYINTVKHVFKCQGCSKGGDVIVYLQLKGYSTREAFRIARGERRL